MTTTIKSVNKKAQLLVGAPDKDGRVEIRAHELISKGNPSRAGFIVRLKRDPYARFVESLVDFLDGKDVPVTEDDGSALLPVRVVEEEDGSRSLEVTSGMRVPEDVVLSTIAFTPTGDGRLRVAGWAGSSRVIAAAAEGAEGELIEAGDFVDLGDFSLALVRAAFVR